MSSVDPLQQPRSDIQPGHLSSHEPVCTELAGNRLVHGRVELIQTDVEAAGMPVDTNGQGRHHCRAQYMAQWRRSWPGAGRRSLRV